MTSPKWRKLSTCFKTANTRDRIVVDACENWDGDMATTFTIQQKLAVVLCRRCGNEITLFTRIYPRSSVRSNASPGTRLDLLL